AGVSTATVDRVLNGRLSVRAETARKVQDAARMIGFHAADLIARRVGADLSNLTLGVILGHPRHAFAQAVKHAMEGAARRVDGVVGKAVVTFADESDPPTYAGLLDDMAGRVDAVAAIAVDHPDVTAAVERLARLGVPCFAMCNDFAQGIRHSYIGLDNLRVGRMAAHMLATAGRRSGPLSLFVGGHRWNGHDLRETGFRSYIRQHAPEVAIMDTMINHETRQGTYDATCDLLDRVPDLRGLYCAGGGMEGAIAALRERRAPREVALVVNELTEDSRRALADRYVEMVISTPLDSVCDKVFALARGDGRAGVGGGAGQYFLRPDLYLPESI
ncbi:transcriptional regulator, LacI family, partial [Jannaschia faecimaris]